MHTGPTIPDRSGGDCQVSRADERLHTARGTDADESICTDFDQLFNCNGCRWPPDAGGGDRYLLTQQGASVGAVLAVMGDELRIVKIAGNAFTSAGVSGQEDISPHIACFHLDVVHHFSRHICFFCCVQARNTVRSAKKTNAPKPAAAPKKRVMATVGVNVIDRLQSRPLSTMIQYVMIPVIAAPETNTR